jgi:hypothetical protein
MFESAGYGDKPKGHALAPDVRRYSRNEIMAHVRFLWESLYEPNIAPAMSIEKKASMKEEFVKSALEDFDKLALLPDQEYVAFIRWQRGVSGRTIEEFKKDPGFKDAMARVNEEFRKRNR